jgi:biotin carboxyl carrier protein
MKYKITVNDQTHEVEIEDINVRPIVARVDGIRFEVMPENGDHLEVRKGAEEIPNRVEIKSATPSPQSVLSSHTLTAPLPGTVTEVFVKAGEQAEAGQVMLIIEAMKMKNSIRSTHSGMIQEVLVSAGQSVAHKQVLVQFEE